MAGRLLQPFHAVVVQVVRMRQPFEVRENLLAHRVVDADADERRRRATDGAQRGPILRRDRPLALQRVQIGHEPKECGSARTRAAGRRGQPGGGLAHVADAAPHQLCQRRVPRPRREADIGAAQAARARPAARPTAPASAPAPTGRHSRRAARHCARSSASARRTAGPGAPSVAAAAARWRAPATARVPGAGRPRPAARAAPARAHRRRAGPRRLPSPPARECRQDRAPPRPRSCCGLRRGYAAGSRSRRAALVPPARPVAPAVHARSSGGPATLRPREPEGPRTAGSGRGPA